MTEMKDTPKGFRCRGRLRSQSKSVRGMNNNELVPYAEGVWAGIVQREISRREIKNKKAKAKERK